MIFAPKKLLLKDGRMALLRAPEKSDAAEMIGVLIQTAGETDFLMNYPEELAARLTVESEEKFLAGQRESERDCMIVAEIDGRIAGNCSISRLGRIKTSHRATIGIAILQEYCALGLGTALMREMISVGKAWSLEQIELGVFSGNKRALALYEKMGFRETGRTPRAFRMQDGQYFDEIFMAIKLEEAEKND